MERITSGDAEIFYEILGSGPPVVLLHPFPANHEFWHPVSQALIPRLLGKTTRETRPDLVDGALAMMRKMSPEDVAQVQRGMAERPDSVPTLKTINVPTLVLTGDEDILTGSLEAEFMHSNIAGSEMKIVPRAGHFSPWEQSEQVGKILRQFLDSLP